MINIGLLVQIWDLRTGSLILKWYWSELERRIIGFKTESFTRFWSNCTSFQSKLLGCKHFICKLTQNLSNWVSKRCTAEKFSSNRIKISLGSSQLPFSPFPLLLTWRHLHPTKWHSKQIIKFGNQLAWDVAKGQSIPGQNMLLSPKSG